MAALKRLLFYLSLTLILSIPVASSSDHSSLQIKHSQLQSKILNLESSIDERSHEINFKDERIKQLEKIVLEKSNSLASLHSEIQSLQKKVSFNAKEQLGEAHARANELEKQVENLKKEIAKQNMKKDALEARINVAESKIVELNVKLEKLHRVNEEQKIGIRNTERAIQKAEEERIRVQFKAARYSKELAAVYESWLPPWLAVHLFHYQSVMVTSWNVYGRSALDVAVQKALETGTQVRRGAHPYIDVVHKKWIPTIKEQWLTFVTNMEPLMQILTAKSVEIYHTSVKTLKPHIDNLQAIAGPYVEEAKKFMKPYINQLSNMLKPHFNKARIVLKPYTKKLLRGYRKFTKYTLKYHRQARVNIRETLMRNEFTSRLASNELVWFMASALMVLPVMVLLSMTSSLFRKKSRRRTRTSHTSHQRRRPRRVHPNKANTSR